MSFPPILYLEPPKIAIDSNRKLIENSNDTIVCHAIGSPNLGIYWKLDDISFPSDKLDYNSIKRMNKVVDDQLNVTCVAENQFGADFRTISIDLIGKMKKNDKLFYKLYNFEFVLYFYQQNRNCYSILIAISKRCPLDLVKMSYWDAHSKISIILNGIKIQNQWIINKCFMLN